MNFQHPTPELFVAPGNAATTTVKSVDMLSRKMAVYNISVDGEEEYYANGLLVHNSWRYGQESWDQASLGLRLGDNPQAVITTTPRPIKIIKDLIADPATRITRGSTYDNIANLADAFIKTIVARYSGTRLGRQELQAEILDDVSGALWTRAMLDRALVKAIPPGVTLRRVVVALDPSVTSGEESDEFGIIVAALGSDGHGYVLHDATGRHSVTEWPALAIRLYRRFKADRIVAEVNNGGDMIEATLRMVDASVSYSAVHATRGKVVRAEPVAALYEKNLVHHVGSFPKLEDEQAGFTQDYDRSRDGSPNRVDALVWALTELKIDPSGATGMLDYYRAMAETAAGRKDGPAAEAKASSPPATATPANLVGSTEKTPQSAHAFVTLVCQKANAGGIICGISRTEYKPDEFGRIFVLTEDAAPLKRAGFLEIPTV